MRSLERLSPERLQEQTFCALGQADTPHLLSPASHCRPGGRLAVREMAFSCGRNCSANRCASCITKRSRSGWLAGAETSPPDAQRRWLWLRGSRCWNALEHGTAELGVHPYPGVILCFERRKGRRQGQRRVVGATLVAGAGGMSKNVTRPDLMSYMEPTMAIFPAVSSSRRVRLSARM